MQFDLAAGPGMHDIWSEVNGNIGRVTLYTNCTPCPPPAAINAITGPTTVCEGDTLTYTVPAQTGATAYNWTVPAGATIISGQNTTSLSVNWTTAPGGQICVDWTDACPLTSPQTCLNVTVNATPTMTTPTNIIVCAGDTVPLSAFVSNPIGGSFAWDNSNTAIGLGANGGGNIPAFVATNTTTTAIVGTVTVTPTVGICLGTPITYTITVNPSPIPVVPTNLTYCPGVTVPASVYTSNPAGATYSWTNSNPAIGLGAAGAGNTPSFTSANPSGTAIVGTITVIGTLNGCASAPVTYTITIDPTPAAPTALSVTTCPNNITTLTATAPGGNYEWFDAAVGGNLLIANASYTTPALAATKTFYVQTTLNGCLGPRTPVTVTIGNVIIANAGLDDTICDGASYNLLATPNGPTYSYSWDELPGPLAFSTVFNPAVSPTIPTSYVLEVTDINNCVSLDTVELFIYAIPTMATPTDIVVCNGTTISPSSYASTPAGGTFTWTNSVPGIGLAANGAGNLPSFAAVNVSSTPIVATITVTPTVNGCVGTPVNYTITVNPGAVANVGSNLTVCNGDPVPSSTFSSVPAGGTFSWTNTNINIGLAANGSGNTPLFNAANPSAVPITGSISVVATTNGCPGAPSVYTITVNPAVTGINNISICQGDSALIGGTYYSASGAYIDSLTTTIGCDSIVTNNLTVNPVVSNTFYQTICNGDSALINGNYYSIGGTYPFTLTSAEGCDSLVIYELFVDTAFPVNILASTTALNLGQSSGLQAYTGQAGTSYLWSPATGLSCVPCPTTVATPPTSMWYYVTSTNENGCETIDSIYIEVDPTTNLYIPNIFSPNGDKQNDVYRVRGKGIDLFNIAIYNRWGQKVFESDDITKGWNGTKEGATLNQGVFVYKVNVTMYDGTEYNETGNITLIR